VFSFYGLPAFQRHFGDPLNDGTGEYAITPAWQAGISNAVQVGSIMGLLLCGFLCDKIGYVRTISFSLVAIICFIFITFFAVNLTMLLIGEMLCGIPWGEFAPQSRDL
jgi:SP family general alpha glucoside:H+ symporter-like MFS transporter